MLLGTTSGNVSYFPLRRTTGRVSNARLCITNERKTMCIGVRYIRLCSVQPELSRLRARRLFRANFIEHSSSINAIITLQLRSLQGHFEIVLIRNFEHNRSYAVPKYIRTLSLFGHICIVLHSCSFMFFLPQSTSPLKSSGICSPSSTLI